MCVYDELHYTWGHVELGQVRQRCGRAFDDASGHDVRTVEARVYLSEECKLCMYNGSRDNQLAVEDMQPYERPETPPFPEKFGGKLHPYGKSLSTWDTQIER